MCKIETPRVLNDGIQVFSKSIYDITTDNNCNGIVFLLNLHLVGLYVFILRNKKHKKAPEKKLGELLQPPLVEEALSRLIISAHAN